MRFGSSMNIYLYTTLFSGDTIVPREPHQIVLHVVAALPGDKVFGHIPHDCDEGLLLALTGFFTDMALSWFLGMLSLL